MNGILVIFGNFTDWNREKWGHLNVSRIFSDCYHGKEYSSIFYGTSFKELLTMLMSRINAIFEFDVKKSLSF